MRNLIIRTKLLVIFMVLLAMPAHAQSKNFSGKWLWKSKTSSFEIHLIQTGTRLRGAHFACVNNGSRVDNQENAHETGPSIVGNVTGNNAAVTITSSYSEAIGKATMNLENGKLRWVVTQKPKGEYYFPDSVILSKQKGAVVEIAKQASPLVVSQMLSRKARENESEGRFDEALSLIERAIKQDPQDHTNYVTRGDVLMALSKFDTAIGAYSKALELCPANSQYIIKSHRGRCYVRTKQLDLAVTDLTVAIDTLKDKVANIKSLKPYLEKSYRGRAEAYTLLGKSDLASKDKTEANSLK